MKQTSKVTQPVEAEYEHPDDKANRERCEAFARSDTALSLAQSLIESWEVWALITTYADGDALEALEQLRERFWVDGAVHRATSPSATPERGGGR